MCTTDDVANSDGSLLQLTPGDDSTSVTANCIFSPLVPHRNQTCVNYSGCSQHVLIACLLHQFTKSGGVVLKNSIEWMQSFIVSNGLRYICHACQQVSRDEEVLSVGNFGKTYSRL